MIFILLKIKMIYNKNKDVIIQLSYNLMLFAITVFNSTFIIYSVNILSTFIVTSYILLS